MSATRAIVKRESVDVVAQFRQRSGGGSPCQSRTDHNHVQFALIVGTDQLEFGAVEIPLILQWSRGNLGVE
jgi:hypothetical protein